MTTIAFIGLGNMGNPMAANLVKAGFEVHGFDLMPENLKTAKDNGIIVMANAPAAVKDAEVVVTMLPAGKHVISVYEEPGWQSRKRHAVHRFVDDRRGIGPQGACHRREGRKFVDRRAGLRRHRRCGGRHTHLHGRRLERRLRQG